jgi:hypothetical protein
MLIRDVDDLCKSQCTRGKGQSSFMVSSELCLSRTDRRFIPCGRPGYLHPAFSYISLMSRSSIPTYPILGANMWGIYTTIYMCCASPDP